MDSYAQDKQLWPLVSAQLPPALATSAHAPKLPERLPWEYQKSVIVKSLASRLVYREGLSFIEAMPGYVENRALRTELERARMQLEDHCSERFRSP